MSWTGLSEEIYGGLKLKRSELSLSGIGELIGVVHNLRISLAEHVTYLFKFKP